MTIADYEKLEERVKKLGQELQAICNEYNVTFEGRIEMTTNEEDFNERLFVSRGFKYNPNNK